MASWLLLGRVEIKQYCRRKNGFWNREGPTLPSVLSLYSQFTIGLSPRQGNDGGMAAYCRYPTLAQCAGNGTARYAITDRLTWEATSSSLATELTDIFWNTKVYYLDHNSLPLVPNLRQMNPVRGPICKTIKPLCFASFAWCVWHQRLIKRQWPSMSIIEWILSKEVLAGIPVIVVRRTLSWSQLTRWETYTL